MCVGAAPERLLAAAHLARLQPDATWCIYGLVPAQLTCCGENEITSDAKSNVPMRRFTFETNLNSSGKNDTSLENYSRLMRRRSVHNINQYNAAPPANLPRSKTHDLPRGGIS